jgi:single-strand DNA-binding protein
MSTQITIEGNLTAKPEIGYSDSGTAYVRFSVAVNDRRFDRETNQWIDEGTVYHRVVAFRALAENTVATFDKGAAVIVVGKLVDDSFIGEDDRRHTQTRIEARNIGPSLQYTSATITKSTRRAEPAATGA